MKLKSILLLPVLILLLVSCGGGDTGALPTYTPYLTYTPAPAQAPRVVVKEVVATAAQLPTYTLAPTPNMRNRFPRPPETGRLSWIPHSLNGHDYFNQGNYQKAIDEYNEAIRLNPQHALSYGSRGLAYYKLGQYERAIQDYNEAIRLYPQYAISYGSRGLAYYKLGQYERAIQDYDEAIRLYPQYVFAYYSRGLAYYNRGVAYRDLDKSTEAERDLEKAKELGYPP